MPYVVYGATDSSQFKNTLKVNELNINTIDNNNKIH